jgi:hypothetical protein
MARSEQEVAKAIADSDAWTDAVDPARLPADAVEDRKELRQIGVAMLAIEAAEQSLVAAVSQAKARGRSWTDIANVLGVSRQAARQRFDARVHTASPPLPIFVDTSSWHAPAADGSPPGTWTELMASQRRLLERLRESASGWVVVPYPGSEAVGESDYPSRSDEPSGSEAPSSST